MDFIFGDCEVCGLPEDIHAMPCNAADFESDEAFLPEGF